MQRGRATKASARSALADEIRSDETSSVCVSVVCLDDTIYHIIRENLTAVSKVFPMAQIINTSNAWYSTFNASMEISNYYTRRAVYITQTIYRSCFYDFSFDLLSLEKFPRKFFTIFSKNVIILNKCCATKASSFAVSTGARGVGPKRLEPTVAECSGLV